MGRRFFVTLLMVVCCAVTFAQTNTSEYEKEMERTILLQGQAEMFAETLKEQLNPLVEEGKMSSEQQEKVIKELSEYMVPLIVAKEKEMIKENYSLEELKELNAFLASPIGRKNVRLAATSANESAKVLSSPEVMEKMMEIMMGNIIE